MSRSVLCFLAMTLVSTLSFAEEKRSGESGVTVDSEPTKRSSEPSASSATPSKLPAVDKPTSEQTSSAPRVRQSDRSEMDRIVELYMAGRYQVCSTELRAFLDPDNGDGFQDGSVVEDARLYFATCGLLMGKREEAREALLTALRANPLMQSPDSLTFPPPVVSLFLEVRDEVQQLIADQEKEQVVRLRRENERARRRAEARLQREQQLEKMAREEQVILRNSRWIAAVPFGAGQYQNGSESLGTLFLVSEGLLAGTALTSALILEDLASQAADSDGKGPDAAVHNTRANAAYSVMKWSSWGLIGVALVGVAEAQWNFKGERKLGIRERKLPPPVRDDFSEEEESSLHLQPLMSVTPLGGFLGLSGQF